jgi:hypothetical protein
MIKKLTVAALLFAGLANAQSEITLGTGTAYGTGTPVASWYDSSATESLYTATEIGTSGTITKLAFNKDRGGSTIEPQVKIYLKKTTAANLATAYTVGSLNGYTLAYEGGIPNASTSGWMEVTLQTPFAYSNAQNLAVLVVGSTCIDSGRPQYRYTSASGSGNKMSAAYNDGVIGCGGNNPWTVASNMTPAWERPNLRLNMTMLSTETFSKQNNIVAFKEGNSVKLASDNTSIATVKVFDTLGRQLYSNNAVNNKELNINLAEGSNGLLLIHITDAENRLSIKKLMN